MHLNLGYARVSTDDQLTQTQLDAFRAAGCGRLFEEHASGGRWDRPELHRMLDQLRACDVLAGDVVVIWKLDRLSPSRKDLLNIIEKLDAAGAGFRSLTEAIDTTTTAGRMMGVSAKFERETIRERTGAELEHARRKGRHQGSPFSVLRFSNITVDQFRGGIPGTALYPLDAILQSAAGSLLAVLKRFGTQDSAFPFPMEGYILALDLPINTRTLALLDTLDRITLDHGGRFYLAKDAGLSAKTFAASNTRIETYLTKGKDN